MLGVCIFNLHVCLCTMFMSGPVKVLCLHVSAKNKPRFCVNTRALNH